uniref:Uncharacterized protein n=1 Tax=Tetranychus urticae TaxID=32264 RepID=T1L6D6_TETUR
MVNVRVAISTDRPIRITNDNKLEGPYASNYEKYLYFVTSKSNVTYVEYDQIFGHRCFPNGTCQGILNDLQQGLIDLSMTRFSYDLLGVVGPNLTTIVQEEEHCDAIYKQNVTEIHSNSTFFEFLTQFDLDVCIRHSQQSIFKVIWHHCEYLLYQNFGSFENLHKKWLYIIYIVTLLLVSKLLSSTMQTGLIIYKRPVKLESFQNIVESGYRVSMMPQGTFCRSLVRYSLDPHAKLINKRFEAELAQLYAEQDGDEESDEKSEEEQEEPDVKESPTISNPLLFIYSGFTRDNLVTLMESNIYNLFKRAGCTFAVEQEMRAPLINKHISTMFTGYLMSKRSSPSVRKLIFNGYYTLSSIETYASVTDPPDKHRLSTAILSPEALPLEHRLSTTPSDISG